MEQFVKKVLGIGKYDGEKFKRMRRQYRRLRERVKLTTYPQFVGIENTTRCNSACKYCARPIMVKQMKMPVGDMADDVWFRIVDQIQKWCPHSLVNVCGLGEPLLDNKFLKRVATLRETMPNARLESVTNGILLSLNLVGCGLDVLTVSLNSFSGEVYHKINGVRKFRRVRDNIISFLKEKNGQKPNAIIQILDIDANRERFDEFKQFFSSFLGDNDRLHFKYFENAGGYVDPKEFNSQNQELKRCPCHQLWSRLIFSLEGDVYPCCLARIAPDLKLGNIMDSELLEIIENGRLDRFRKMHLQSQFSELESCRRCNIWAHCHNPFFYVLGRWR